MKKVDINVTEATMASLSIVVGDVIADKNDDKYNILYIDYTGESVVCGYENTALILSFDVIAGGEYQQVVGDQCVPEKDINDVKVPKEGISAVKASISLIAGDYIIDNTGTIEEVSYIDYTHHIVVAIAVECETVVGDLSSRSRASIISFDTIVSDYEKVTQQVMELENIVVILIALLSILLLGLIVLKQNLGAFAGLNYPVTWLLWLHLIHSLSLHTYWMGIVSLRAGFFMGRIEDLGGFIVYNWRFTGSPNLFVFRLCA